ncbi:MAG: hypothetical protein AAF716_23485 [Cyanobacteria bacterium P01_D01_bin.1]
MASRMVTALRKMTGRMAIALVGMFLCLGLIPTPIQAAPFESASTIDVDTTAVSSDALSPEKLSQKRAERRQAQSQASAAANTENEESATDKLNLEEIVEDNVLLGNEPEPSTDAVNMPSR